MKRILLPFVILMTMLLVSSCAEKIKVLNSKEIKASINGLWRPETLNHESLTTDDVILLEFKNNGKVILTYTEDSDKVSHDDWIVNKEIDYDVKRNILELNIGNGLRYLSNSFEVRSIDNYHMVLQSGEVTLTLKHLLCDYTSPIIGLWEGVEENGSVYSDADHFWSYLQDGSYSFFKRNEQKVWYKSHDLFCDYLVKGDVLFTHWTNTDKEEFVENWIIDNIVDGVMKWISTRKGRTVNTFVLKRMISDPKERYVSILSSAPWQMDGLKMDGIPMTKEQIVEILGVDDLLANRTFGVSMIFNPDMTLRVDYRDASELVLYFVMMNVIYTETISGMPLVMNLNPIEETLVGAIEYDGHIIEVVYKMIRTS